MKHLNKILGLAMLVFAIGFNLWLYRLEPTATVDPNDNAFQFALVDRTNQIWDFAKKSCTSQKQGELRVKKLLVLPVSLLTCFAPYLVDHWVPNWAEGYNLPYYYGHVPQIVIVASWRFINALSNFIRQPLAAAQGVALRNSVSLFTYYHWVTYLLLSLFPLSVFLALGVIKLPWLAAGIGALLASHISTDGLYGLDPPSFLWRGYGLSSQLFAMIWMPLAIAYSFRYFAQSTKSQAPNPKQIPSTNVQSTKPFGTFGFGILKLSFDRLRMVSGSTGSPSRAKLRDKVEPFRISNFGFRISDFWMAVIFLTFTAMGHLGLGMIALLSLLPIAVGSGVFATSGRISYLHLWKLVILAGTVVFFLSYWIIPIFLADNYHNFSFWDPPWKFASYGARETTVRLLNGDLFDWGRGPWMTILVIAGLIGGLWPWSHVIPSESVTRRMSRGISFARDDAYYFTFSLFFIFWLLLYFGRTTWGGLIDLIPGMREFHLSRFIVGVHAAGLFLAPIGIEWLVSRIIPRQARGPRNDTEVDTLFLPFVYLFIGLLVYWIIYPQTISYAQHNDRLIKQANENHAKVKTDEEALFAAIRALPPGRVFAGRGGWWGKDFRVAETPYYMNLSTYGIPTVLWLPETWSPNSDVEQYFSEDQAKDYDLFGIRYVAAPSREAGSGFARQKFWKLIDERETWKLYEVTRSVIPSDPELVEGESRDLSIGYFTTGVRPAIVSTTKRDYGNVVRLWIQSDAHAKGLYPQLTFAKDYPRPTGLPNFKMLDEVTYKVPDGSTHNLFQEPPWYQNTAPAKRDLAPRDNHQILPIIKSDTDDSDMIFEAKVDVPEHCTECIVVLKQSFHPNWKATIDGKSAETFTVFPFFLAILVPAGTHEIVFSYEPSTLKVILFVSEIVVLLFICAQAVHTRLRG